MDRIAVITGDMVASRALAPEERRQLYADLQSLLTEMKEEGWISSFEVFRGDALQCLSASVEGSLRVALMIRCYIKAYTFSAQPEPGSGDTSPATKGSLPGDQDIRLAIGIGGRDINDPESLAHSDGEAFWFSGTTLDGLKNEVYRIMIKTDDPQRNESLEPTMLLLDAVMQKWTNNQAETIYYKLRSFKEEAISKALNISQPAVNQRIRAAQWFAIERLLQYFEKIMKPTNS